MMTDRLEGWGDSIKGMPRPTGLQVLPIAPEMLGAPINDWQYLALARTFRKWLRSSGYTDTMPKAAYDRWCGQVGIPVDECEGILFLPGYSLL